MLDHGDAEGEGLSGTGGGLGDHIFPLHKAGNGLLLNGGGIAVALLLQGLQHLLGQPQAFKSNIAFFHWNFVLFLCIICYDSIFSGNTQPSFLPGSGFHRNL